MKNLIYQGQKLPVKIAYHSLKKSKLEIFTDFALITLCYDLSSKQQKTQIKILIDKLYISSTKAITENTIKSLHQRSPRNINKIRYKKMTSRWGSASGNNNLNFNIDLAKLPINIQKYIIAHEYSHLFEMNHSPKFWDTVEKFDPNHKIHRTKLRNLEKEFLREIQ